MTARRIRAKSKPTPQGVAIITGAAQGIGRVFARAYASTGGTCVIADLNAERGKAVAQEIAAHGFAATFVQVDVSNETSVTEMVSGVVDAFGRVDALVNNAAIFSTLEMRPFDKIPLEEWDAVLRVNVTGAFLCSKSVAPVMRRQGGGRIINMGSAAVTLGRPNYLHYIASKGALEAMTRAMARELGGHGICVNTILPGATFTEVKRKTVTAAQKRQILLQQCIHRPEVADDLVGTLLFLLSDASAFITGQTLTVDGGATHR